MGIDRCLELLAFMGVDSNAWFIQRSLGLCNKKYVLVMINLKINEDTYYIKVPQYPPMILKPKMSSVVKYLVLTAHSQEEIAGYNIDRPDLI